MSSANSSDSDVSRRGGRRLFPFPPPPPMLKPPPPKKKKKTLPPQETINKIWSRFSAPKFSQATKILPFAASSGSSKTKIPTAPKPEHENVLVSEDFDRAVQECRTRVKKLIRECKRVNMRYRDPDFDIDWDLKWEKGYCLNGLGNSKFEISGRAFANPTSNVPKAVKRVHEIFDKPTFLKDKVSPADVRQGSLGDCWLMASLTALANMEVGLHRICVEYDTKIGIYGFVFHRDGEWIISIVDDKLYLKSPDWDSPSVQRHLLEQTDREDVEKEYRRTYQTGSQSLFFAHCADQNATWLPLLEKAYAKAHGDYAALGGGWIGEGVEDLTGGVTTELLTSDILDTDEFWENEILKVNKEFLFGCSTGLLDGGYGTRDGISEGHAYVIMEARELSTGERLLKLRNPWGKGKKGQWEGAWSDGSKEFTPEAQIELKHKFGSDSVFWISYQDLLRKYQHFDRTRLFMDSPDWRITQKWVSLDVPWKAEFQQMFRIVLKKESPVVLVLSQLDDRYFEGLQGQYSYRLQFRLHEVDSPDDEDYIVRSHGNYLMERSVVTELKSLSPGTYTVFIMIVADRDPDQPSVEDVVKKECRKKVDNDKLAQVGVNYDYAHSKASVHLEAITAARKALDKKKAREARIAARRKNWEKRHLGREIMRKQEKKNRDKRDAKDAKELAAAKDRAEKKPKHKASQTEVIKEVQVVKEDKAVQTDDPSASSAESDNTILPPPSSTSTSKETDKAVQTDDMSDSQTVETPKSSSVEDDYPRIRHRRMSSIDDGGPFPPSAFAYRRDRRMSGPYGHPPPPPPPGGMGPPMGSARHYPRGPPPPPRMHYITSDGESSASPIDDFDDMYSDDDPTLKPRPITPAGGNGGGGPGNVPPPPGTRPGGGKGLGSDDEDDNVDPWNAVCIVGFRVYSQDEGLELSIYEEGMDDVKPEIEVEPEVEIYAEPESIIKEEKGVGEEETAKDKAKEDDEEGTDGDVEDQDEDINQSSENPAKKEKQSPGKGKKQKSFSQPPAPTHAEIDPEPNPNSTILSQTSQKKEEPIPRPPPSSAATELPHRPIRPIEEEPILIPIDEEKRALKRQNSIGVVVSEGLVIEESLTSAQLNTASPTEISLPPLPLSSAAVIPEES